MKKILIMGDKCPYNKLIVNYVIDVLCDHYTFVFCLDFNISLDLINICLSKNKKFTIVGYQKDINRYFKLNEGYKKHLLEPERIRENFLERTYCSYEQAIKISDIYLFLAFAESSNLLEIAEYLQGVDEKVFCVPGNICNKCCTGSNFLLKTNSAIFVRDPVDVINHS